MDTFLVIIDKNIWFVLDYFFYMNNLKKLKIIEDPIKKKFNSKLFNVWLKKKRKTPGFLICFWCSLQFEPKDFFGNHFKYFVTTKNGEVFERPVVGHNDFNNLYKEAYIIELCNTCFYNLDMFNKTGLWCEYKIEQKEFD